MPLDSIPDLRLFVKIYEQGGISTAAELLGITPAVASKRLQRLEGVAGEALFHRSTRRLSPTGAGIALYNYALAIIAAADEAQTHITGGGEPAGFMRVTAPVAFGRLYLAELIADFLKTYPKVQVDAIFTDKILDMVEDSVDIAIRIALPATHPNLIMRRLCSGQRFLCASPGYLRMHGHPEAPRDLKRHNCVVLNHYDLWKLGRDDRIESVRVNGSFHSNDGEAVLDALRRDLGIGVVALWHGARDIQTGHLVRVLPPYELTPQPEIYAVYHPNQRRVLRVQRLIGFIEKRLTLP